MFILKHKQHQCILLQKLCTLGCWSKFNAWIVLVFFFHVIHDSYHFWMKGNLGDKLGMKQTVMLSGCASSTRSSRPTGHLVDSWFPTCPSLTILTITFEVPAELSAQDGELENHLPVGLIHETPSWSAWCFWSFFWHFVQCKKKNHIGLEPANGKSWISKRLMIHQFFRIY